MDHVPKWVAAPASDSVLSQGEVALKHEKARAKYARKTATSESCYNSEQSTQDFPSTQVKGVESGSGAEKKKDNDHNVPNDRELVQT